MKFHRNDEQLPMVMVSSSDEAELTGEEDKKTLLKWMSKIMMHLMITNIKNYNGSVLQCVQFEFAQSEFEWQILWYQKKRRKRRIAEKSGKEPSLKED